MRKIREWMHGRGRKTVITVERHGKWGLESAYSADVQETVSPKPQKDYYVGGASIGGVKKGTTIATGDTIEKDNEDDEKNKK